MQTPGKQKLRDALMMIYERRVQRSLPPERIPRHIGVIIDGNRRWARSAGNPVSHGHEAGASKITEFLHWCDDVGVKVVTVWMLSTDNLTRPADELEPLLRIIEQAVDELTAIGRWRIHPVGALDLLPSATAETLKRAETATQDSDGMIVNVAVGYGGRRELADAVRSLLLEEAAQGISIEELAERVDVEHIARHLYTKGQPDPDLVIRTSGEQRLGGFLLWQSALSEFYFCEALWPDFRHVDFLRAVRSYAQRERRFGT
ncbi:isoprenyl transferase [Kribbella antibiotica]|uniref:Isoprenyl transferase n=1 Tax=Kribbella antibiotica TaxID=190195 RepID=A0A4R4Z0G9_9ACTN|nr:isoprenyl transferase [Kribbella antibiotica]TDD50279.1 isoprenyl transferase [Kribbella antibiotica]